MTDFDFMALALDQARDAALYGEVPVGAVIVRQGKVIATGRNALVSGHDPSAHAEIIALRAAAKILGNYRLDECELFVTLEPCAMCSGAILNARIKRVVFGAAEPKTGAAGSVINLFAQTQLNHQTECQGGVLAEASSLLMQAFFRRRRLDQRETARLCHPLRDDALRTPDSAFDGLPSQPWSSHYRSDLPTLDRLRMHYLDEQRAGVEIQALPLSATYLCLHDFKNWSYGFHQLIPSLLDAGHRVVVPDLVGFGKSDKPKKIAFHTLQRHHQILVELVEALDLHNIVLLLPERQSLFGLTLPMAAPQRYRGLTILRERCVFASDEHVLSEGFLLWQLAIHNFHNHGFDSSAHVKKMGSSNQIDRPCNSPFPSQSFRAGERAFAEMSAAFDHDQDQELVSETENFWKDQFIR